MNEPASLKSTPAVSIVVPVYDEAENVGILADRVRAALADREDWELVFVDDGSRDTTAEKITEERRRDARVRLVRLARNYGQTPALQAGFDQSRGDIVVSMDGDLQNDPADIPMLLDQLDRGYDIVVGYRVRRKDRLIRRKIPSWVANRLITLITGVSIRDNGCSLKAYRRALLQRLHLYSDMHRFIPGLAVATAGATVYQVPVRHHPRIHGESKYGLSRIFKVLADLLTLLMIRSFRERPLLLFSLFAAGAATAGAAASVVAVIAATSFSPSDAVAFVLPGVALVWFGLAGFLLMLGFVSEVALWKGRRLHMERPPLAHRATPAHPAGVAR